MNRVMDLYREFLDKLSEAAQEKDARTNNGLADIPAGGSDTMTISQVLRDEPDKSVNVVCHPSRMFTV